jgi:hypothetical protein
VLLPDALERSRDPAALLANLAGYVGPEGRLVASARNREAWPLRVGLGGAELGLPEGGLGLLRRRDLEGMVRAAGLEVLTVAQNPLLLKAARAFVAEAFDLSLREGEESATGFRDLSAYELYLRAVRPLEVEIAKLSPRALAYQHVVVARRPPEPGPLSLTVGMLTMDEEPSVARMIDEIRPPRRTPGSLCVDSSVRDRTPEIAAEKGRACSGSSRPGGTARPWSSCCTRPPPRATPSSTSSATSPTRPRQSPPCAGSSRPAPTW